MEILSQIIPLNPVDYADIIFVENMQQHLYQFKCLYTLHKAINIWINEPTFIGDFHPQLQI